MHSLHLWEYVNEAGPGRDSDKTYSLFRGAAMIFGKGGKVLDVVAHDAQQLIGDLRRAGSADNDIIAGAWGVLLVESEDVVAQVGFLPLGVLADGLVRSTILAEKTVINHQQGIEPMLKADEVKLEHTVRASRHQPI